MQSNQLITWMSTLGAIGVVFGIFYSIFGLNGLPVYQKLVPSSVYVGWSNGLYGSVFIGFSVLIFFVGRHAFQTKNKILMKSLLYGIMSWLIVEAFFSLYYGVIFNIFVDIVLAVVMGLPLILGLKAKSVE